MIDMSVGALRQDDTNIITIPPKDTRDVKDIVNHGLNQSSSTKDYS